MKRDAVPARLWRTRTEMLEMIVATPENVVVRARSTVRRPCCPDCETPSRRAPDRRGNKVRDLEVSVPVCAVLMVCLSALIGS